VTDQLRKETTKNELALNDEEIRIVLREIIGLKRR